MAVFLNFYYFWRFIWGGWWYPLLKWEPMRSYPVKENPIGSARSLVQTNRQKNKQTNRQTSFYFIIRIFTIFQKISIQFCSDLQINVLFFKFLFVYPPSYYIASLLWMLSSLFNFKLSKSSNCKKKVGSL